MKNSNEKVSIFQRLNKLKLKAGIPLNSDELGHIDPQAIKQAQEKIDEKGEDYLKEIEAVLIQLDSTWKDSLSVKKIQRKRALNKIYNYANNAKDLAETYNFRLMAHFGQLLRDFCERVDLENENHRKIVQAHIDVMWVAFEQNIQDDGGPVADELKKVLAQAIEKYL